MRLTYILDDAGDPIPCDDILTWGQWMQTHPKHIGDTWVDDVRISTIFTGVDTGFHLPMLFETMLFLHEKPVDGRRYSTREEALAGHSRFVSAVEAEYQRAQSLTAESLGRIIAQARTPVTPQPKIYTTPRLPGPAAARRRRRRLNHARYVRMENQQ